MKLYVKSGRKYYYQGKDHGPGDAVDVPDKYARALTHPKGPLEQRQSVASAHTDDEIRGLRSQYREVAGKGPFMGWDAAILRQKIAEYRTTNMGDSSLTTHLTAEE